MVIKTLRLGAAAILILSVAFLSGCGGGRSTPAAPLMVASVMASPNTVVGGESAMITVSLTGAAATGGAVVTLMSNNSTVVQVPGSLTIAAGQTSGVVTATSTAVAGQATVTISATYSGASKSVQLIVTPAPLPTVGSVTLNPTSVTGGSPSTATVTLSGPAPVGGSTAMIASSNTALAQVPSNVTVAAGQSTAMFTITTSPVSSQTTVMITVSYNNSSQSAVLTITPSSSGSALVSVTLRPSGVVGGNSSTGTATLNGPAPSGGAEVSLTSSDPSVAQAPPNVTIAAGQMSATFTVTTTTVNSQMVITITGSYNSTMQSAELTVEVPGNYTLLCSFMGGMTGLDGAFPTAAPIQGSDGYFYGTTNLGGANSLGTVYKVDSACNVIWVYSFTGGSDGGNPFSGLIQASDGNFYGTTAYGGAENAGEVYKINAVGTETALYSFTGADDGGNPEGGLVQASNGLLYGTTSIGGTHNVGVIYQIDTSGNETAIYSFTGGQDGNGPLSTLVQATDGNLYGTTTYGGTGESGVVFRVDLSGNEIPIYSFTGHNDGGNPYSGVVQGSDGDLYGITYNAGVSDLGVVFKMTLQGGSEIWTYSFTGGDDGANPFAGLIQATNGFFYGTTFNGGTFSDGVIFKIDSNGNITSPPPYTFGTIANDGSNPEATIVQSSGNLYGATTHGGTSGNGTLFSVTPASGSAARRGQTDQDLSGKKSARSPIPAGQAPRTVPG